MNNEPHSAEPLPCISRHFTCGAVAVHVSEHGGSYDIFADDSCSEYLGNVCSLSEAARFLTQDDSE
ncbi:hypothetical protein E6B08_17555 [Pseudomonas putida]|uniref:Uncharacterized protein n=1 Tax=Pseudomonas putida TaxID=303 RepID=A0A4D6XJM5_PSEPU|nr:hypothetical protein [Pseudomonas putida]QCI13065.1 hypothetical protein E6B08_17555 [Pseudomonas putida]